MSRSDPVRRASKRLRTEFREPARAAAAYAAGSLLPDAPMSRRAALAVALALTVAWGIAFAPLLGGRVFVVGDAAAYRPYADLSRARWAQQHDRTLWNPYVFCGLPSAASLADPRPQWLPGPLLSLADAAAPVSDRWRVPLAVLAGALAMAALARSLWRCGPEACAVAGGGWLVAPMLLVPLAFGHEAEVWTLALWPLVALAARATLAARTRARAWGGALLLAGVIAAQVLGAHPQFLVYGLFVAAMLVLPLARGATRFAGVAAGAAVLLALAMSAAVWLPAWHFAGESVREVPQLMLRQSLAFSAGTRDVLSSVWPHAAGFGDATYWGDMRGTDYPHFVGAALAALALCGVFGARVRSRGTAIALAALCLFALLGASGPRTPLGNVLALLPLTRAFRTPITWLAIVQFAAALLAARGLHATGEGRGRVLAGLGAALAIAGVALLATGAGANVYADAMTAARGATAGASWAARAATEAPVAMRDLGLRLLLAGLAVAFTSGRQRLPARLGAAALSLAALAAAFDLGVVSVPIAWRSTGPASALAPPVATAATRSIAADPRYRAMSVANRGYFSNDWIAWRARSVSGLHGAAPRRWEDVHFAPWFRRDASVRWLLPAAGDAMIPPIFLASGWKQSPVAGVFENSAILPRARAVPRVLALMADADVRASLADSRFAPESLALTTEAGAAGAYAAPSTVRITWREDEPDRVALAVSSPARAFVVLADAWMPGWSATLDGSPLVLYRVDHVFRGVVVPAGTHDLRFAYLPPGWRAGVALAWSGWWVFVAAAIALAAGRRRGAMA